MTTKSWLRAEVERAAREMIGVPTHPGLVEVTERLADAIEAVARRFAERAVVNYARFRGYEHTSNVAEAVTAAERE